MILNNEGIDINLLPVLFQSHMIVLDGRKTNTRRPIKPQPDIDGLHNHTALPLSLDSELQGYWGTTEDGEHREFKERYLKGDVLWCRETHWMYGFWIEDTTKQTKRGKNRFIFVPQKDTNGIWRHSFEKPQVLLMKGKSGDLGWYKRPSLFMPLGICRCFVEVTEVVVPEELTKISAKDAIAEGIEYYDSIGDVWKNYLLPLGAYGSPVNSFMSLWDSINGEGSFYKNPWVWRYAFRKLDDKETKFIKFLANNPDIKDLPF